MPQQLVGGTIEVVLESCGVLGEYAKCIEGAIEPEFLRFGYAKPEALQSSRVTQQDRSEWIDGLVDLGLLGIVDMLEPGLRDAVFVTEEHFVFVETASVPGADHVE